MRIITQITIIPILIVFLAPNLYSQTTSKSDRAIDTARFKLITKKDNFVLQHLSNDKTKDITIPRDWLIPPQAEKEEAESYVSSFNFDEKVTSFTIGPNWIGIHLSSYDIQKEGSANASAGRDVFLVYDSTKNRIFPGKLNLGKSSLYPL